MSGFVELGVCAGGVGGDEVVALAGVLFERGQLRVGVRVFLVG
ncbi:MAG: hypothetical protein ACRDQ4_01140 [Pseudonocardiaceae bacterium]